MKEPGFLLEALVSYSLKALRNSRGVCEWSIFIGQKPTLAFKK